MYIKFDSETIWANDGSWEHAYIESEIDLNGRLNAIEEQGDRQMNLYRDSKALNRAYTLVLRLGASRTKSIPELMNWWEDLHTKNGGERTVERVMTSGRVLQLTAVPEAPQWSAVGTRYATVTQVYTAALPLWKESAEQSDSAAYTAAVATTCAFNNEGTVPTWVRLNYAGAVTDPWVGYSTDWEIEWDLDIPLNDELDVNTRTPATVWYRPNVGADYTAYGYRTNTTSFRRAKLPVGSGTLDMVAAAGTGVLTVYWYNYFEAFV